MAASTLARLVTEAVTDAIGKEINGKLLIRSQASQAKAASAPSSPTKGGGLMDSLGHIAKGVMSKGNDDGSSAASASATSRLMGSLGDMAISKGSATAKDALMGSIGASDGNKQGMLDSLVDKVKGAVLPGKQPPGEPGMLDSLVDKAKGALLPGASKDAPGKTGPSQLTGMVGKALGLGSGSGIDSATAIKDIGMSVLTGKVGVSDLLESGQETMQSIVDEYKKNGYKPTAINQLWCWGIFMVLFMFAWQLTIQTVTRRYDQELENAKETLRRPYLIALCAYAIIVFLLNMAILYIFAFIGCTALLLSAPYVPFIWEPLIYFLFLPEIVFSAINLRQIPFHFFTLFTAFSLQLSMVWFYISERELNSPIISRAKMIRILVIVPGAFLGVVYGCYAIYCAMSAA